MRDMDRIIAINGHSLQHIDFLQAQDILRAAIHQGAHIDFTIVRANHRDVDDEDEDHENDGGPFENERGIEYIDQWNKENTEQTNSSHGPMQPNISSMNLMNTKRPGKRVCVQLVKGAQGLGFKLAARDNCTPGEYSPIYIKSILPKGAAIQDGRLQRGDRLLEVNQIDMTQKTLHEAVNMLRNTKLGSTVEIVVSRQVLPTTTSTGSVNTVEQVSESTDKPVVASTTISTNITASSPKNKTKKAKPSRQLLVFQIPFNDTGSAGLGVSVKGKTKRVVSNQDPNSEESIDLGIFVKTVISGGAASKDGRLKPNDQLINVNGFSLLGMPNEEAMLILRDAMQYAHDDLSRPGHIELTVSRKAGKAKNGSKSEPQSPEQIVSPSKQVVKVIKHNNKANELANNK